MENGKMTKDEEIRMNVLMNIVHNRYKNEGKELTRFSEDAIWYDLLGTYEKDGFAKAKERALYTKLR